MKLTFENVLIIAIAVLFVLAIGVIATIPLSTQGSVDQVGIPKVSTSGPNPVHVQDDHGDRVSPDGNDHEQPVVHENDRDGPDANTLSSGHVAAENTPSHTSGNEPSDPLVIVPANNEAPDENMEPSTREQVGEEAWLALYKPRHLERFSAVSDSRWEEDVTDIDTILHVSLAFFIAEEQLDGQVIEREVFPERLYLGEHVVYDEALDKYKVRSDLPFVFRPTFFRFRMALPEGLRTRVSWTPSLTGQPESDTFVVESPQDYITQRVPEPQELSESAMDHYFQQNGIALSPYSFVQQHPVKHEWE